MVHQRRQGLAALELVLLALALAASLTLAACGGGSSAPSSGASAASAGASAGPVKTAANPQLGTLLVDARGMTLYHLTGEGDGKFVCDTAFCEKHWPPLSASATNTAISGLGKVKRPDGMEQLTYNGEPLYTFTGDTAPGQVNGQGAVEGGRWIAVKITASGAKGANAGSGGSGSAGGSGR
jgi:predicted lipoprotein with Yx(FWY)xxD motif